MSANDPLSSAIAAAKGLTEQLKTLRGLESYGALLEAASSLQEQLASLSSMVASSFQEKLALMSRIKALEEENKALLDWAGTAKHYVLKEVGHAVFVQAYQPDKEPSKPMHWACARCFEDRQISVLQRELPYKYTCPRCTYTIDGRLVHKTS